ncbi:MAG: VCBS repeat-containing protein [Armatimonadota bacterium]|nr:MAG: VCBS repeat-containing protein [Armatimonadota bacterium]
MMRTPLTSLLAAVIVVACIAVAPSAGALELETLWRVAPKGTVRSSPTLWSHESERGVVVTTEGGAVTLYGADGKIRWSYDREDAMYHGAAAVADLDLDGAPETIAVATSGDAVCLDAAGKPRWAWRLRGGFDWCSPLIADLHGDQRLEVALPDALGYVSVLDCEGRLLWRFEAPAGIPSPLAEADLDGDGRSDLLVPYDDGALYALASGGRALWLHRQPGTDLYCAPTIADLDGDGRYEVLQGYGSGRVVCLDGAAGTVEWAAETGSGIDSAVSVADLDADGTLEIFVGHHEDGLMCLSSTGEVVFQETRDLGQSGFAGVISAAAVADVDGDGRPEIVYGYRHGPLVVLDSRGAVVAEAPQGEGTNATPVIADLDGDGRLEIVIASIREVVCLTAGGSGRVQWASFRNTPQVAGVAPMTRAARAARREESAGVVRGEGPALAFSGFDGDQSVLVVGPVKSPGLAWAQVRRPDGVTYSGAQRLRAGESLTVRFEPYAAGRYTAQARVASRGRTRANEISKAMAPFPEHTRVAREAVGAAWESLERLDLAPASAGAGLLARLSLLEGMAARVEQAARVKGPQAARELSPQAEKLVRQSRHLEQLAKIVADHTPGFPALVWQANPWLPFDEAALPASDTAAAVDIPPLYQDERRPVALNLLNVSERTLPVRVEPEDLTRGDETLPWQGRLEILVLRSVGSRSGAEVWDPLPKLGPDRLIEIPSLEARQLWLILDTAALEPGRYALPLNLVTTEQRRREKRIALEFEVMPLSLKDGRQLRLCNWGYFYQPGNYLSRCQDEAVADLVKHGTNVFVLVGSATPAAQFDADGNMLGEIDWSEHDRIVGMLQPHGILLYCGYQSGVRGPFRAHTPVWEKAHVTLVRELVEHLAEMGIGYDDFALYPVDEPGLTEGNVQEYLRMAQAGKRADPRVKVYTDPVGRMTLDKLREAAPYTDIWCPGTGWAIDEPERVEFMLSTGNPVWSYSCGDRVKTVSPTDYYRKPSWYAFRYGLTGVGFWTYCTTQYQPWRGDEEGEGEYVLVYPGDEPVSSKRWEAAAMGIQDYAALDLLRQAIESANGTVEDAVIAQAERARDEAVNRVVEAEAEEAAARAVAAKRGEIAAWTLRLHRAADSQ